MNINKSVVLMDYIPNILSCQLKKFIFCHILILAINSSKSKDLPYIIFIWRMGDFRLFKLSKFILFLNH